MKVSDGEGDVDEGVRRKERRMNNCSPLSAGRWSRRDEEELQES